MLFYVQKEDLRRYGGARLARGKITSEKKVNSGCKHFGYSQFCFYLGKSQTILTRVICCVVTVAVALILIRTVALLHRLSTNWSKTSHVLAEIYTKTHSQTLVTASAFVYKYRRKGGYEKSYTRELSAFTSCPYGVYSSTDG